MLVLCGQALSHRTRHYSCDRLLDFVPRFFNLRSFGISFRFFNPLAEVGVVTGFLLVYFDAKCAYNKYIYVQARSFVVAGERAMHHGVPSRCCFVVGRKEYEPQSYE